VNRAQTAGPKHLLASTNPGSDQVFSQQVVVSEVLHEQSLAGEVETGYVSTGGPPSSPSLLERRDTGSRPPLWLLYLP